MSENPVTSRREFKVVDTQIAVSCPKCARYNERYSKELEVWPKTWVCHHCGEEMKLNFSSMLHIRHTVHQTNYELVALKIGELEKRLRELEERDDQTS